MLPQHSADGVAKPHLGFLSIRMAITREYLRLPIACPTAFDRRTVVFWLKPLAEARETVVNWLIGSGEGDFCRKTSLAGEDMKWDKLIATVYAEQDFGRSMATTVAGVVGLSTYLLSSDWVAAVFAAIIAFPVCRVVSSALPPRINNKESILSDRPIAEALVRIGKPAVPEMLKVLVGSDDSIVRAEAVAVIRFVEGKEVSVFILESAIKKETDSSQKQRLQLALKELKALLDRQSLHPESI